jgi:hypothetical protein
MRGKVAKRCRALARLHHEHREPTNFGFSRMSNGVVMHAPGSYRAIYKGLKDSYRETRHGHG